MQNMFSLESLIEEVEYGSMASDYGNDHGMYGMEAFNALGESEILFVSLESFQQSIDFTNAIVRNSFESLDDYDIRKDNKYTEKLASMESKIGETVKKIIEKLIEAVKKFMRQIQAFISGPIMRGQAKFYEKNKEAIAESFNKIRLDQRKRSFPEDLKIYPWAIVNPRQDFTGFFSLLNIKSDSILREPPIKNSVYSLQERIEQTWNVKCFGRANINNVEKTTVKDDETTFGWIDHLEDTETIKSALKNTKTILKNLEKASKEKTLKDFSEANVFQPDARKLVDSAKSHVGDHMDRVKVLRVQVKSAFYLYSLYMKFRSDVMKCAKSLLRR